MSSWQSDAVLWDLAVPSLALQAGFPLLICFSLRACSLHSLRWGVEISCNDAAWWDNLSSLLTPWLLVCILWLIYLLAYGFKFAFRVVTFWRHSTKILFFFLNLGKQSLYNLSARIIALILLQALNVAKHHPASGEPAEGVVQRTPLGASITFILQQFNHYRAAMPTTRYVFLQSEEYLDPTAHQSTFIQCRTISAVTHCWELSLCYIWGSFKGFVRAIYSSTQHKSH